LRHGELYLQRGVWGDARILPEAWVDEATRLQAQTPPKDRIRGWGYNFTIHPEQEAFGSGGAFGQNCLILPKANCVIAITAGVPMGDQMQAVKDLVWKHMLPAFSDSPLPDNNEDAALLSEKLRNLTPRTPGWRFRSSQRVQALGA